MTTSNIRWARLLGGTLLVLIGSLWALQGAGIVGGSMMSGQSQWLIVGAILVGAGLGLAVTGIRGKASR